MGLFDKVRILVGALVHKPFAPRPHRVDLAEESTAEGTTSGDTEEPVEEKEVLEDTGRVADLIDQRARDEAR